jgi:hypothetical protein
MGRIGLIAFLLVSPALAQEKPVQFVRDIRPILSKNCFECHGPDEKQRKGKLRLDQEESARKRIVPGEPAKSLLFERLVTVDEAEKMPPKHLGKTLTSEQVGLIEKWIKQGAKWGQHWSFEKPVRASLPHVKQKDWPRSPIDYFVLARLESEKLAPSPEADRATLARRVAIDLTGLPPSPDLYRSFLQDRSPDAYERYVDALLASPAFGERWARVWLDLARYADSKGYEKDLSRTLWRYRDWVIEAFNRDLPYDQFTREQLAGDLLPKPTTEQILATAFHRNTMVNDEGGTDDEEFRVAAVKDRVDTTMQVWMGLTMGCAKCHTHKYDPISHREYYQFYAFFNQSEDADTYDERPKLATPTRDQERAVTSLKEAIARQEQELRNYSEEFKKAAAQWEEQARGQGGWLTIKPSKMTSASGSSMKVQTDQSILVEARKPARETYSLTLSADLKRLTALRLEVLPDKSHPKGGVGRSENDGNFVLSRWVLKVRSADGQSKELSFKSAKADFAQTNYPIDHVLNNPNPKKNGWAVSPMQKEKHTALFVLTEPYEVREGDEFDLTIDHQFEFTYPGFSIGRFRLYWTGDDSPDLGNDLPMDLPGLLKLPREARTPAQQDRLWAYYAGLSPLTKPARDKLESLQKALAEVPIPQTPIMRDLPAAKQRKTAIHLRGNFLDPGEEVKPTVPVAFHSFPKEAPRNRLGVADWLVHPDNPLTARVAVNRFWAQFFGTGIVESQEDFGSQGTLPSHPELLDYLAVAFRKEGWSMKRLCKTIVTSATYRQSSRATPELLAKDPNNRLLARGPRFRLEAEMIRDVSLATSGLLSPKMLGPSVMPPQPDGLWRSVYSKEAWIAAKGEDRYRRGLYTFMKRTTPYPAMTTLDAPSREICAVRRINTNTPLQALVTLNDGAFIEMAQSLAREMLKAGATPEEQIRHGLERALLRPCKPEEVIILKELYQQRQSYYREHADEAKKMATDSLNPVASEISLIDLAALTAVGNVILNLDEFLMRN